MTQHSHLSANVDRRSGAARLLTPLVAAMGAVALAALAGCGPDTTPSSNTPEASSAPSAGPNAAAAAMNAAPSSAKPAQTAAAAPGAPACPKLVTPTCPTAPAATAQPPRSLGVAMTPAARRVWRRPEHVRHYAWAHRGHAWRGEERRPGASEALAYEDREAMAAGYRMRDELGDRFHAEGFRAEGLRAEGWRAEEGRRMIIRRREGGPPACPGACPGAVARDWDFAGIDQRGYLVWPGKVEY